MRWGKAGFPAVFLLVISGMLILIIGDRLYYRILTFLLVIFIISAIWSQFSLHGIEIKRYCRNQRMQIGQLLEEKYEVHNRSPFIKLWLEIKRWIQPATLSRVKNTYFHWAISKKKLCLLHLPFQTWFVYIESSNNQIRGHIWAIQNGKDH